MIIGTSRNQRTIAAAAALAIVLAAGAALAQTPPGACGSDTLYLYSPAAENVSVTLSQGSRFGAVVSWPVPDPALSTCAVIQGGENLDYAVDLIGSYHDHVDRELLFTSANAGQVGGQSFGRLQMTWSNRFAGRSGRVAGSLNLSNSGGLLRYDVNADAWSRLNGGLPNYLNFTNIQSLAQSPRQPGRMLAGLDASTAGTTIGLRPRGLWLRSAADASWERIMSSVFTDDRASEIRGLGYSPQEDGTFAVGTYNGLFICRDEGSTWQTYGRDLDPAYAAPPSVYSVDLVRWAPDGRLFVGIQAFGLFVTEDAGGSWRRLDIRVPTNPADPAGAQGYPRGLRQLVIDPADPAHLMVVLRDYGIYHSLDSGVTWQPLYGDWLAPASGNVATGFSLAALGGAAPALLLGTDQRGMWRSADGGQHWTQVGSEVLPAGRTWSSVSVASLLPATNGVFALLNSLGIARSQDEGQTWQLLATQPSVLTGTGLQVDLTDPARLLLASTGGGVYTPGEPIPLSRTIDQGNTDPEYQNLDLGLSIIFHEGHVDSAESFSIKAQDFQGYAVWRSEANPDDPQANPFDMQMMGLYDKTNPETCIEGYCGDRNYTIKPRCFAEKRAACFDFSQPGEVHFFDDNIYNGTTYYYAVTTFDYGNVAGINPSALANEMLFSPRYPSAASLELDPERTSDDVSVFTGQGNFARFQVNVAAQPDEDGEEIYVFPNPLRYPDEQVVFTNLPLDSRIEIFTLDGDQVASLPEAGQPQQEANIYWQTKNPDGKMVASGIYIWRIRMPKRGDYWGKLVIIR